MEKTKRLLTSVLASAMILASAVPVFAAESGDTAAGGEGTGTTSILDSLSNISYSEYLEKYSDVPMGETEVVIEGIDYDKDATTAEVSEETGVYGEKDKVLLCSVDGDVTWTFNVETAGMYNVEFEYAAIGSTNDDGLTTSGSKNIERVFYINGEVPFSESRLISLKKTWTFQYTENQDGELRFEEDANGNELRPDTTFVGKWESYTLSDTSTYYIDPYAYYFKEGKNTITLEGASEDMYIRRITLTYTEELPSYEDVLAEYASKGYTTPDVEAIRIDAETPAAVSSSTMSPNYDRSSAITDPQDPIAIKRNTIGGSGWTNTSEWVKYTVTVPEDGLYNIVLRFKQDTNPGTFVSRAVKIDGEYPFEEARACSFEYGQDWQVGILGDTENEFQFYLEAGEHEIEMMATVGQFGEVLTRVEKVADQMNDAYLQIVKLTGPTPDENLDYGFSRVMPEVIKAISQCADDLEEIIEYIGELNDGVIQNTAELESAVLTLRTMGESERSIAENLSTMKSSVSDLSSWCVDMESQPITLDYIQVQPVGSELPTATAGFMDSLKYELAQFFGSFYADYNTFASEESDETVEYAGEVDAWMTSGRDRATIVRDLVNSGFCAETNINVSIKLVDGSGLLPSILAGIGPDINLDGVSVIDWAIRGAVLPLNDMEGFDEICNRFYESALIPHTLYGQTYALPVSMSMPMMFVRTDILASLDLEIPKTWDDFFALIPVLQYNNMTILGPDYQTFLYQSGGSIWDESSDNEMEHGWRCTYDDNLTLEAFTKYCNMYTEYSLIAAADFQTRFKTGVAPVAIQDYSAYTTLTVFAPELAGLWEMTPIPGTVREDGTIDNTAVISSSGISMLKGTSDKESLWKFMCWYTDVDFQVDLCNELISLLGTAAKTTTANIEAMAEMPWSQEEYEALIAQYEHSTAIHQYPGNYVIDRYTSMAFNAAYSNGENPAEALLQYVDMANKEISRKRAEFGYPIYEESSDDN